MNFFNKLTKRRSFKIYFRLISVVLIILVFIFQRCYSKKKKNTTSKVGFANNEAISGNNDDYKTENSVDQYSLQLNKKNENKREYSKNDNDFDVINDNEDETLIEVIEDEGEEDDKVNEEINESIYIENISIKPSFEKKNAKSDILLPKHKKQHKKKACKIQDNKIKNENRESISLSTKSVSPVSNTPGNTNIENDSIQTQHSEEESANNNEITINTVPPLSEENQRQHILINDYLEAEWKEEETDKLINCFASYFYTSKSEISKRLNPRSKIYKHLISEIYMDNDLIKNKTCVFIKNIKKDLFRSIQIIKSVLKKISLNFDSYQIYNKKLDLCSKLVECLKAIATTIKIVNYDNWYNEQLGEAVVWSSSALEAAQESDKIQKEIILFEEKRRQSTKNTEILPEQIIDYSGHIVSTKDRFKQLYARIEAFVIYMGGREINNLNEDNIVVNRSKQELQNKIMDINQITNFAMIEFIIVKYISSGMLKFQNLDPEKKIELFSNFQKIKEISQRINQFREDAIQMYDISKIHGKSISDILQRTLSI